MVGSILRVGFAARLLAAEARGEWIGLQLVYSYAQNMHLGVLFGMFRSVPMLRARGDDKGADDAKATAFTFITIASVLAALALAAVATIIHDGTRRRYALETGLLTILTVYRSYYVSVYKAESRFATLSVSAALGSIVSVATVALIWFAALDGLIWGMIAQAGVELAWLVREEPPASLKIRMDVLRGLLTVGLMTLATALGTVFITTIDRTVMLSRLGTTSTGYYYLGANLVVLLPTIAGLPATVITPRFFERFGATGNGSSLVDLVDRPVRAGAVSFAAILGVGALAIPSFVAHVWPDLVNGDDAARLALICTFPVVLAGLVTNVFYAMNRQLLQLVLLAIGATVTFACAHIAVSFSKTIAAAVAGSLIGLMLYYGGVVLGAFWLMLGRAGSGARLLISSLVPAATTIALVLLIERVGAHFLPPASIVRAGVSELVFCACFGPWTMRAIRRLRA